MEWNEKHDIFLCREILAVDLFKSKKKTTQRAQLWQQIADNLCRYDTPVFSVSKRAVRDRHSVVTSKYRKRMQAEERASGIDTEQSELDVLLEELIERENLAEEEGNEFKRKVEEDKCKALDIRKTAMENLAQTKKRKVSEDGKETKKKSRRSDSETIEYLREKGEQELRLREQELELKKQQQEAESKSNEASLKKQESVMQMMVQQQQQMQQQQQYQQQAANFQVVMAEQNQMLMNLLEKFVPK